MQSGDLASGGGVFVPTFASGVLTILASSSGVLATITPPAGERVLLMGLVPEDANLVEANVKLEMGGQLIIQGTLTSNITAVGNRWSVGETNAGGNPHPAAKLLSVLGGVDEAAVVTKTSGTTQASRVIYYGYQFGVLK